MYNQTIITFLTEYGLNFICLYGQKTDQQHEININKIIKKNILILIDLQNTLLKSNKIKYGLF